MFNSIGHILRLTSFGESHGVAIGGILDGFPAGVELDFEAIKKQLARRKPGQSNLTTARIEADDVEFLSGIYNGRTTGHSIGFLIQNQNQNSSDYTHLENVFRPSHADFTYQEKYGIRDPRGGGRASARETTNWVVAGTLAKQLIPDIQINSFVSSVEHINYLYDEIQTDLTLIDSNIVRCPDAAQAEEMIRAIEKAKAEGDSVGGTITCVIKNMPIGLGEPIFHKLEAELAKAMLTLNACKGFEIGSGFAGTKMRGSQHNDSWKEDKTTKTNHSGGIQGGISNGMDIVFCLAFKPTATIMQTQSTINDKNEAVELEGKGRHDPCVLPRAVPIVDALTAFVLADLFLLSKTRRI
ncbi:MAG: chorismate synthase [Chitinophagales bacterium]|nr:chorismate synthase [Chitinophagales bacterium]